MAVMNLDFAYIACLWGNSENDFAYRKIVRDYDFEDAIIEEEQYFWEEYVEKRVEPEFIGKPDVSLKCLKMYLDNPDPSLGRMALPVSFRSDIERYIELKNEKSRLDADKKKIEDELKRISVLIMDKMGAFCESELSVTGKKFVVSFKPQKTERILSKELEKLAIHHKDVYDEYVTVNENRKFTVKELITA